MEFNEEWFGFSRVRYIHYGQRNGHREQPINKRQ